MEIQQHVFLSDVHLGAFSAEKNSDIADDLIRLIRFSQKNNIALYILGDLFDYWMEYPLQKFVPNIGYRVLDAFEDYNRTVKQALYITGNHDNWNFGYFENRGFDVEENFRIIQLANHNILLLHGDGVDSDEINFPRSAFHRLLRNPLFVQIYQNLIPPKHGISLMKWFSDQTRKRNSRGPEELNEIAENLLSDHYIDYLVCGHDHIPRMETLFDKTYINLGTFYNHRTVALYNKEGFNLVTWDASTEKFLPVKVNQLEYEQR